MKSLAVLALAFLGSAFVYAAPKPCEELKSEIAAKLDAKGVKGYTLDIVEKDKEAAGTIVGSCEAGSKKIVYQREGAAPAKKE
jgi:hypothetical protein